MITARRINLQSPIERESYGRKLREFEREFTYPLGVKSFYIAHGAEGDYFAFFERLGRPHMLVLEDGGRVIGAVCLVLREINGAKAWYACDFKISRDCRGKKLYRKWMRRFFLPLFLRCRILFGINMASPEENKLWRHAQRIFRVFSIGIRPCYLYEFRSDDLARLDAGFLARHALITNHGVKDIVVDGVPVRLYHLVQRDHLERNLRQYRAVPMEQVEAGASIMYLGANRMELPCASETVISMITRKMPEVVISSAEI